MNIRQKWAVAITSCVLALLVACASADAVATFAASSSTSLKQGTNVFADFPASFVRGECDTTVTKVELRTEPPTKACEQGLSAQQTADLAKIKQEQRDLTDIVNALVAYFDSIHELAGFGGTPGKSSANANKQTAAQKAKVAALHLGALNKLDSTKVDAVNALAGFLIKEISAGYRDRKLQEYLGQANDSIEKTTQALEDIVLCDYALPSAQHSCESASLLNLELADLKRQFDLAPKRDLKDEIGAVDALNPGLLDALERRDQTLKTLIQDTWDDKVEQLRSKDAAAHTYADMLKKIREGHDQMAKQKPDLTAKALAKKLEAYSSDLQSLTGKLEKAFFPGI